MLSVRSILLLLGTFVLLSGNGCNADLEKKEWWENTIVYQIWLRGFQDSNGDGEGDIRGIINRLDHFEQLGVETIWLSPIYTSPLIDSGYDVSDYVNINPLFGTLDDFDELVEKAHAKDLKVMLDVVPNQSSDKHDWFNASVHSVEPYTSYYIWANGTVQNGTNLPPNNWISTYSMEAGSAWTWNKIREQWYYHKFHTSQPDLNLRNAAVVQELLNILTFWLERDVDGFHFSSVSYLFENEELLDEPTIESGKHTSGLSENSGLLYEIHAHIADWVASSNSTSKLLIAASDDDDNTLISYYGNDTHTGISPFNYRLIKDMSANTNASTLKATIEEWLELLPENQNTNWALSNHDHSRVPSRISLNHVDGLHMLSFLLPGQTFTYYGEEIAMLDTRISWNQTIDPLACAQTQDTYATYSRDPARTPMQWDTTTSAGFSTNDSTYLPVNSNYLTRNVETQLNSNLANIHTYKSLASLKKKATITHGDYQISAVNNDRVLVLRRSLEDHSTYVAVINLGLARQTVNLTELYSDVPEYLYIAVASNNAVTNSTMISVDTVILTANAALVLTDEEPENTAESSTATPDTDLDTQVIEGNLDWWQSAVIYQIYPKSFQDSDNNGIGDLPGIISRLDHLIDLGVTGIWFSPIYKSPQKDGGYDISNYTDIDPLFGTMRDFEKIVEQAHDNGLKVILDFVPNHSSKEHPWFINSVSRIEPYTDYYIWVDGITTANGTAPPNNWLSMFGGSAWAWNEERQQYYFHQFDAGQPDLNYRNPKVVQEMNDVLTFWLDKGVNGFRMDAISHLVEDPNLYDEPINPNPPENTTETDFNFLLHIYTEDQKENYELVYSWRALLDSYAAKTDNVTRLQMVESFSSIDKVLLYEGNGTHKGAHVPFNFGLIFNVTKNSGASGYIKEITSWLNSMPKNSTANWVLGNHDQNRVASRFGVNLADGLNMLSLLLPGIAFTYYGEEIAMLNTFLTYEQTQDPHAINAGPDRYQLFSRDPARTPFQWDNTTSAGFSGNETTWLPVNSNYPIRNLALQASRERSVYKTYKAITKLKQTETIKRGSTKLLSLSDDKVLAIIRELHDEDTYVIVINLSAYSETVDLSALGDLPSEITICLASSNAIANTGDTVNISSVSLSANAALVLCTTDFPDTVNEEIHGDLDWWQTAAIYQIYPKSFKDSNGDGVGDIQGIISQLNYFNDINIDAIWLGPIYTSPQKDGGYDISNYLDIDPLFGSIEEFEALLESAHDQGLKVILEFIPNHSSVEHQWFVNSVARVEPYTDYYIWRDGVSTDNGTVPPNNWISVFGGSAWTWNEQRQQYYLHQFSTNQPDLNLENQDVIEETNRILRFWLRKGVDGFRIGSVSHLVEDSSFQDEPINENADEWVLESDYDYLEHIYTTNQNISFDLVVQWRSVIDDYVASTGSEKKFLTVEPTSNTETALRFLGNDTNPGAHTPPNFNIIKNVTRATSSAEIASLMTEWLNLLSKNITPNWVLGSHDFDRVSSRFGINRVDGLHMLSLLLPGISVTYQGEELGLQNVPVSWNQTQDPKGLNAGESRFELFSRDPARTPFLWDSTSNAGFTTGSSTWLPITSNFQNWNLDVQSNADRSYYNTYKSLTEFRKLETFKRGATKVQSLNDDTVIAFSRELSNEHTYLVVINVDIYRTSVDLTGFDNLLGEDLVVCLASANSIVETGADVNLSEVQLSANAALLLCPRSAVPEPTTTPEPTTPAVSTESPAETEPILADDEIVGDLDWWQSAVIYQIYPKSFQDSDNDGTGDLPGITSRLDHLIDLGVTGFWLNPIYRSPQKDGGYDISNYTDIDPLFGTIRDFEKLVEEAHDKGLKVILDFVPNHSSKEHPWFINSVSRIEPYTDYYIWVDGITTANGTAPPNNWLSIFGGSAWTWNEERQQYYLHQFDTGQPDLNYRNPKVVQEMNDVLTFWLEKGVDGFRMDAISHLFEDPNLYDEPINPNPPENTTETDFEFLLHTYTKDQNESYELVYSWRTLLDSYAARTDNVTRLHIVESVSTIDKVVLYQGNETHQGAHMSSNFGLITNIMKTSGASVFINEITSWFNSTPRNSTANWVIGNHDNSRVASRFGINRADGLNMLSLLLPGIAFTYYGEEIAMLDTFLTYEQTQDPHAINAGPDRYQLFSRDPARTPFQWDNTTSAGFSGNETTWLPVNSNYLIRNLALQASRERSVYKTYKAITKLKQTETIKRGSTKLLSLSDDKVLAIIRELHDEDTYVIVINLSPYSETVDLSALGDLPSEITICLASANAIANTGDTVNIDSVSLSANAALVLCTTDFPDTANEEIKGDLDWWQTATIYHVYPKSFKDSNGDGVGDIQGIISQLDHFTNISVDAIWLGPVYTSPQYDHGYDVSNYRDVDPLLGTLADLESLLEQAHARGIRIILEFVPNHSSVEHVWFANSVARVAPYTDYYIWQDGVSTDNGTNPPNNWISAFGGSAWTWNEQRQQYYLHQFGTNQPDLNLENPNVVSEMNDILRFWLEKGFDGFRIGSVSHLVEDSSFRDEPINENADESVLESDYDYLEHIYTTNQEMSFDLVVQWRSVIDHYVATTGSEKKFLTVEPTSNTETALRFLGNDTNPGAHSPLNFNIVKNATRTSSSSELISLTTEWLNLLSRNVTPNWVLGSHDFDRVSSRFGINRVDGLHMLSLLLPGISVTYQGEELGLQNVPVSWSQTQDPKGLNAGESRFELFSRDPARTPFLWDSTSNAGFTTGSSTWLPITSNFQNWNLDVQSNTDRSYYNTYKSLTEFRKLETFKRGATKVQSLNDDTVIAFSRELSNEHTYLVVINADIYRTSVDLTGFDNLLGEDLVVCLASANSIVETGADVNLSEVQLSANAALLLCPRSAVPEPTTTPEPTTPAVSTESPVETEPILANDEIVGDLDWWQSAAIYQVYPKSFKDSNGDGVGDIQGIISQLDHFTNISVDAIWLGPVYTSPQYDHGYDVSNYRDVDPLLGTLADLESLLEQAHARGIRIILEFVPNHSSVEHVWFTNSVARVAPYTDYYIWQDGVSTDNGTNPPNNWISAFGGSAWTWNEQRQQYYLHQFGTNQPDLNLENPNVVSEMNDILRFWLEKGFDGFRIGSVSHLVEDSSFRDEPINENADESVLESDYDYLEHIYTTNQNTSFDLVVQWRSVIDDYVATTGSEKKFLTVEPTSNTETALRFLGNDTNPGAHSPLNFNIVKNATRTSSSSELISLTTEWLNLLSENVTPNWVLGSHDFDRVSSRFGINRVDGLHMLSLLLPGISVTYQGEELGLQNVPVSWNQTQDPKGLNAGESRFELFSRDPARTPFLWDSTSNAGFTTGSSTWLPITSNFQNWNLAVQSNADRSYYNTYKSLIEFRKLETFKRGATRVQSLNDNTVIAFTRELSNEHTYLVVINADIYRTSVDLTGFDNLLGEDLVVCLASANSIVETGADVNLSEVQLSANAALLLCPRSAVPEPTTTPEPTTPAVSTESPVETEPILANDEIVGDLDWWQSAAIYQVYPKSFKDSNGDGVGDIQGIISQLDHFTNISVDAIWLGPVYTSPQYDHGYDVSNYRDVDPLLGTLADLESLLEQAHARGIRIILEFVPNHSSVEHVWFVNSVARVAPYTDYYIWQDGVSTDNGTNPPNNWISAFGGSAWTWNEQRQKYYLHQFGTNQPDLNLENPNVVSEMNDILRFWLEKGFDGFRIGSVSHLVEDSSFRDEPINENADESVLESDYDYLEHIYTTNQEMSFDLVVQWRSVIDDYVATTGSEKKFLTVEPTSNTETALRFLGNDTNPGAHSPLNFNIVKNATRTSSSSELISLTREWLNLLSENVTPNWVLGSHDFDRVSSRFGINRVDGLHMLSLLLPGISVTYQGEELGLQNVPVSWNQTQDPKGLNAGESRFELFSRDPARTPFLWDSTSNAGFTTGSSTWLPITSNFQNWNLAVQSNADRSYYNTYKSLIEFRKLETFKRGATKVQSLNDDTVIAFSRELSNEHTYLVVINIGIYRTSVDLTGFDNLLGEDLVVCLASANSIIDTGANVNISEVQLSANAALLLCPRSAVPEPTTTPEPTTPAVSTESPVETEPILANDEIVDDLDWWQTAAIYQVYPKSFKDSNGDGVGDIQGIISQLDHFTNISVDAIWLGPVYTSPQYDHGYDVSNYRDVDPLLGTLADLESLLEQAHARGIRIILEFVPNHSSIEHVWFVNSVARVAPYTDYYIWRDGVSTDNGTVPPNNWISVFGGSAWTWNEQRQQYYLHQFGTNQPDLNLENPDVLAEINDILRFWLEKGFDGFRIGSVSHLVEDSSFRDEPINENADEWVLESDYDYLEHVYTTNQEMSFDLVVQWRSIIDDYVATTGSEKKFLTVEPTSNTETALRFLGNDTNPGAHSPLNFNIVKNATRTSSSSELISLTTEWLNLLSENVTPNWVLGSHDFDRVSSRFGINRVDGLHMLSLLLPGISVTYQGEELGLQNVPVSWNQTQDPKGLNAGESRFELFSRDPARTPFLWDSTSNAGFTTGSSTWLPITSNFQNWNLAVQSNADRSYYNTYKSLIEFRKLETFKRGATRVQSLNDNTVIAFTRELSNEPTYAVIINNLFYGTTVDLSGFRSLANEDLVVCLASSNSITTTGSNVTISEIALSANAALLLCPRSELPDVEPETTSTPTKPTTPEATSPPTKPTTPEITSPPTKPTTPEATSPPTKPTTPEITSPPTKPTTPEATSPPTKPTTPEATSPPTKPTTPETTSTPTKPTTPEATSTPTKPTTPETTSPPTEPTTPEITSTPTKPTTPETTSTSTESTTTAETTTEDQPGTPDGAINVTFSSLLLLITLLVTFI